MTPARKPDHSTTFTFSLYGHFRTSEVVEGPQNTLSMILEGLEFVSSEFQALSLLMKGVKRRTQAPPRFPQV